MFFVNDRQTPPALREAHTGPGAADGYARRAGLLALAALVLTVLGPFGTFQDFAFGPRLVYWFGLVAVGAALFETALRLGLRHPRLRAGHWGYLLATAIVVTAAGQTAVVWGAEALTRGPPAVTLPELFIYVLVVTLLVSPAPAWRELKARGLLDPPDVSPPAALPAATAAAMPPSRPAFYRRIPGHLTGDLLALEMEDHYLRIHTDGGSDLILMRLRDAVAELAGADGLQVHRSFWVARAAVTATAREADGRVALTLRNGLRIPVSRSRLAAVRAAGWPGNS